MWSTISCKVDLYCPRGSVFSCEEDPTHEASALVRAL